MPIPKKLTTKQADAAVQRFNAAHDVGTVVRYYPVRGDATYRERKTRLPAFIAASGHACIWLEDERGYVSLDHCEVA